MKSPRSLPAVFARDALISTLVAAIALGPGALPALAGPQGFDPKKGGATLEQTGAGSWVIHAPDGSIIQYSSFDIARTEAVRFSQTIGGAENADARVLNRILSALPTRIEGSLTGNGHIYIVNPAGVFFENGAHVDANAIHAAGGNLSDANFDAKIDRYTSVVGQVQNAAVIRAKAVSLVGEKVVNSGQIIAEDGWIVIAAGNDVLVGRDSATGGPLLRIEGAAGAVFDASATGVTNTGTISATGSTASTGVVKVGAGDLYGTAIFSNSAIQARELALAAGNKGDVALAGDVSAEKLEVSFRGASTTSGQLKSAVAGQTTTLHADELKLAANGTGQQIRVADDIAFRSQGDPALGPNKVTLEQTATIASSKLGTLDIGAAAPGATRDLALRSTAGNVTIDDKAIVAGTNLALSGAVADIQGTDALNVASLAVTGATATAGGNVTSAGDIVATTGGIAVQGNLTLTTKPDAVTDPTLGTLVSAHNGTLDVDGNVSTSNGGTLTVEARNVDLGKLNTENVQVGGSITSKGDVKVGFVDAGGAQQTQTVKLTSIDTRGPTGAAGGNVDVAASGNVTMGAVVTNGGAGSSTTQPNRDGGSVMVRAGDAAKLEIGSIATGGASANSAVDQATIDLSGGTVVLNGGLDASGGQIQNATGARDRAVTVRATAPGGEIQLGSSSLTVVGSNVDLNGALRGADVVPETGPTTERRVDLAINASGVTNLRSSADLHSLAITSRGGPVVLGGNVDADTSVKIAFSGSGVGTVSNGGPPVTVHANKVELAASDASETNGTSAQVALGDGIDFDLFEIAATDTAAAKVATLVLDQDGAIDSASATRVASAAQGTSPLRLELRSNDAVTLDGGARTAVTGTDLVIASRSFVATGATGAASDFALSSLDLATGDALDVNFGVTADKVRLAGAADGDGDLTLNSALRADTIALEAGNGPSSSGTGARVLFGANASLRATDGSARPDRVDLIQDASIDSANLPDLAVFGGSVAGMDYGLQSRDGSITLSAGTSSKFAGSALELRGSSGVNLGSEDLTLASLIAETPAGLVVGQQIQATAPDGVIRLRSGTDGSGDLEIAAQLSANTIELVAGSGNGIDQTARVVIEDGAHFSSASGATRPDHFTLEQDAAIGGDVAGSTAVPPLALFGNGDIAGMEYALRSLGGVLRIDDASAVNGTKLALTGAKGIDLNADLSVAGLDLTGDTTLSGNVASSDDVTVRGKLTLDGADTHKDQSISAGAGDLTALGAIAKSGAGAVSLSGQKVVLAEVSTGHTGDALTISGTDITSGALDASGAVGSAGGNVTVNPTGGPTPGKVVIASINTRGGNGKVSNSSPEDGKNGGAINVTSSEIAVGNVNSGGGDASAIANSRNVRTRNGGNAGAISLTGSAITLSANVEARGGTGSANDPDVIPQHAGAAADVNLHGSLLLAANATAGTVNTIRGDHVVVDGGVGRAATRELGQTALVVAAKSGLSFGGNLAADRIDLEVGSGNLDLAANGPRQISANTIRLAATDGNGNGTTSEVVLNGLTLSAEAGGGAAPKSLTIEQDLSLGGAGSPLSNLGGVDRSVALISHDGSITLSGAQVAAGTKLTLAANGVADATGPAIQVNGDLDVLGLNVGSLSSSGVRVDGDALIDGTLLVGTSGVLSYASLLDVTGDAAIAGSATFAGADDQSLRVGPGQTLALGGAFTSKTTEGKLTLDADAIHLTALGAQTLENQSGKLEIGSANGTGLVKGVFDASGNPVPATAVAGLTLRGAAEAGTGPAVTIHGTQKIEGDPLDRDYAVAVADGDLLIDARTLTTDSQESQASATWSAEGDLLAFGDARLFGRGVLAGGKPDYAITARRAAQTSTTSRGGELLVAGIESADGNLLLRGEGDEPTDDVPTPTALFLGGEFEVAHDLTLSGTTAALVNTKIHAGGDVVLESLVQGSADLAVASDGVLDIRNDVNIVDAAFSASGAHGILLTSAQPTQTIQAGSLSFGSGDAKPPKGEASILRNGDLKLRATKGSAKFAKGQRTVVAGALDISAKHGVVLADTAAMRIDVSAPQIEVRGGDDVVANHISVSSRPGARGPGSATFATPTREQFSGDLAGSDVFLRQISGDPVQLSQSDLEAGNFPRVDGPAFFDFATQVPRLPRPASIVRPRADVAKLAEAKDARPLWADELLVYLDARSRRAPTPQEQGALPPVSAGPNATTPDSAREQAIPAVEQAMPPYRALFRPSTEVDPETGIVQGEDRAPEIQAAFAKAVDVATGRTGATPSAAAVAAAIESDPDLADARAYRTDLGALISAANRALDPDQRARFRELLLARVQPTGISKAEFNALIP